MNPSLRILPFALLVLTAAPGMAQTIPLKTAPIATGDQFFLLPSRAAGMGGMSVALRDTIGDPWSNPATGARMRGMTLFAVPGGYTISDDIGAGFSFAVGGQGRAGEWFGGLAVALQQIDNPNRNNWWFRTPPIEDRFFDDALGNEYVQAFAGRRIGGRTALGVSVFHAELSGVEGVSQLYSGFARIAQEGDLTDWRIGATHAFESGAVLEGVVLHSRLNMMHEVAQPLFTPGGDALPGGPTMLTEENLDRTRTTGVHVAWETPIAGEPGVTLGLAATANRKLHPKIPNYTIANIPRDPGNSTAFALTAGIARRTGPNTVGIELSWLPARSHTWAEADGQVTLPDSSIIPDGGRTVENWFRFSDLRAGTGFEHDNGGVAFRLGIDAHWYRYRLRQERYVEDTERRTREQWFEWTPSWGLTVRPAGFLIQYTGRMNAKGFPDLFGESVTEVTIPDAGIDFLPAPSGPADLPDFSTWTHQVAVSLSLGRERGRRRR